MRAYIDTNVYDYVALRHPKYGRVCKEVLSDVYEGTLQAYGSIHITFIDVAELELKKTFPM